MMQSLSLVRPIVGKYYRQWKLRDRIHIVFVPNYLCNYRCPYCNVWDLQGKYPTSDSSQWLEWLHQIPKAIIDITGGEPFLHPDLPEIIQGMPEKHILGITTNLSYDPRTFRELWPRIHTVTVSYHPHTISLEDFLEQVSILQAIRHREGRIGVNIVAYPDQLNHLVGYIEKIRSNGVNAYIDPYIDENYQYTPEQHEKLVRILEETSMRSKRMLGFNTEDRTSKTCNAGQKHLLVIPDGSSYTCMCGFFQNPERHYMGNVFEATWSLRAEPILCKSSCSCGCDLDWTKQKPCEPANLHRAGGLRARTMQGTGRGER